MLPNPIYALGGLVSQIVTAKVTAEKQYELHVFAIARLELMNLGGFFFTPLVGVGEVSRRLGFDQDRQPFLRSFLGWITMSIGMFTFNALPTARFMRNAYVAASIALSGLALGWLCFW